MTVYKMSGMAYDYLAAIDEANECIWRLDDSNEMRPPIAELKREDVTDCSSWDRFDLEGYADDHDGADWDDMVDEIVFEKGNADVMEKWDDMDI